MLTDPISEIIRNSSQSDSEEDLLPQELQRFSNNSIIKAMNGHVSIIQDGDSELLVFNVNKKPMEVSLGVDLVYWDTENRAFTLIQYKRLEVHNEANSTKEWIYTNRAEIEKQLGLMVYPSLNNENSSDWRMTSPYWFKFVRRDAATRQDRRLLDGIYVPADYLRLAMKDGSLNAGPRGGFRITYDNTKRINKETFIDLVKRGLIGTVSQDYDELAEIMKNSGKDSKSRVIAIKRRWSEGQ